MLLDGGRDVALACRSRLWTTSTGTLPPAFVLQLHQTREAMAQAPRMDAHDHFVIRPPADDAAGAGGRRFIQPGPCRR